MSKTRSEASRMRQAVADASNLHDGAWRDPSALALLASQYGVDLTELTRQATARAQEALEDDAELRRPDVLEAEWAAYKFGGLTPFRVGDWVEVGYDMRWQRQAGMEDAAGGVTEVTFEVGFAGEFDNTVTEVAAWDTYDERRQMIGHRAGEDPADQPGHPPRPG